MNIPRSTAGLKVRHFATAEKAENAILRQNPQHLALISETGYIRSIVSTSCCQRCISFANGDFIPFVSRPVVNHSLQQRTDECFFPDRLHTGRNIYAHEITQEECFLTNTRYTIRDIYICQIKTLIERASVNACHTGRNLDTCKSVTTGKHSFTDARQIVGQLNIFQFITAHERTNTDACHIIRNRYALKLFAQVKCRLTDACQLLRQFNFCKTIAFVKRSLTNACHIFSNGYSRKTAAFIKCSLADGRYTVRQFNFCKTTTSVKRSLTDTCHIISNEYTLKTAAFIKSAITDTCHTVSNCNRRNLALVRIPRRINIQITPHLPLAADGKYTISRQGPGEIFTTGAGCHLFCRSRLAGQYNRQHKAHENYADPQLCLLHISAPLYTWN